MYPSTKQAMVYMAETIKYMCSHLKTLDVIKMVKFDDEDLRHASSYRRATDRCVAQLIRDNNIVPVPVPAINIPVAADVILIIKVLTSATSLSTLIGDDKPPEHLLRRTSRKKALLPSIITADPLLMAEIHISQI